MAKQTHSSHQGHGTNLKKGSEVNACVFSCTFVILSVGVLIVAIFINGFLPKPISLKDKSDKASNRFIAAKAFQDLLELSSLGPKVVGTYENDILAVQLIINKIIKITASSSPEKNKIIYEVQKPSACFALNMKNFISGRCYEGITNIIVKIEPASFVNETILLNCHFDSFPTSPGTSDDGLHCAVMLEILRILAESTEPLKKTVIFLFNGAEETGLLASHGFVTQHKWVKDVSVFINLESCGAGGRETLFQTGPKAYILPKIYAKSVPYPHGTVIGEELFQSGVIPSDTDFRIFRDYGHLKGLDFAHYKNGYAYHTSNDNMQQVSESVIHHTGSNILALVNAFIQFDNLTEAIKEDENKAIFFDFFGFFMICYSVKMATFVNILTWLFSVYTIISTLSIIFKHRSCGNILYHIVIDSLFWIIGFVLTASVLFGLASLLEWRGLIMMWFSNQWFIITYYGVASLYTTVFVMRLRFLLLSSELSHENEARLFIIIQQIITTILLSVGIIFYIRSIYVITIMLLALSVSHLLLNTTTIHRSTVGMKIIVYVSVNILPVLYEAYLCLQLFTLIIPMTGRIGMARNPEMLIWILTQLTMTMILANFIPLILMVRNWWKIQLFVGILYVLYVFAVLFNIFEYPFSSSTPERFSILHVNRKFLTANGTVSRDSGFLITPMDRRTFLSMNVIMDNHEFRQVNEFCDSDVNCGLPSMYPAISNNVNLSYWQNIEPPVLPFEKEMRNRTETSGNYKIYYIEFLGPCLNDLIIAPLNNAKLVSGSLFTENNKSDLFNRSWSFIRRWNGFGNKNPWSFSLKFDLSSVPSNSDVFKVSWSAHFISNNTNHYTNNFITLLNKFPDWTRVVSWVTDYEEFVFT